MHGAYNKPTPGYSQSNYLNFVSSYVCGTDGSVLEANVLAPQRRDKRRKRQQSYVLFT